MKREREMKETERKEREREERERRKRKREKREREADLHVLCGLAVVLQDDGDVHVHDNQETKSRTELA